ncbi:helix-turn-helix domain-containing protein [Pedobacter panaciterrae]|jgi:AraC-type DNA-binding domain-containing proteins|uniref:Helix-turn-helix domain-containing protein n=1 Tax=Pedobacter panaciterrae TaxID=363849 RepID=A0ABU8NVI2_9SPHI|nr:helix-turn-helix domain-containing protein [Pedobacter panaciterrae]NQX55696.1 AraC family transcriptional regulator [Pedobacter panaciterrae]
MEQIESLQEFYSRVPQANPLGLSLHNAGAGHFNVFERRSCLNNAPYIRRDFYKVSLIIGKGKLHYADKWIEIDRPALLFSNPVIPYSWEAASDDQEGWFCLFTEAFIHSNEKIGTLQDSPLFKIGGSPIFFVNDEQQQEISVIFKKMISEVSSDYIHKYDLLRNYLHLIIHEAMKLQPALNFEKNTNASSRIAGLFLELLERQFPIDTPEMGLQLKTANHYAENLSVHVNHLNRAVKEVTGKTTTEHISSRIVKEAIALLQHTDWNVAQVAYGLGFEYPAYFNNFFKKQTQRTPKEIRNIAV